MVMAMMSLESISAITVPTNLPTWPRPCAPSRRTSSANTTGLTANAKYTKATRTSSCITIMKAPKIHINATAPRITHSVSVSCGLDRLMMSPGRLTSSRALPMLLAVTKSMVSASVMEITAHTPATNTIQPSIASGMPSRRARIPSRKDPLIAPRATSMKKIAAITISAIYQIFP